MAYIDRADIEARFGADNVALWADLNSNEVAGEITARINEAILNSDEEVNDETRGGVYPVPWTTVPQGIKDASRTLAGIWLYETRIFTDSETGDGFRRLHDDVTKYLARVSSGKVRFDIGTVELAPAVVN